MESPFRQEKSTVLNFRSFRQFQDLSEETRSRTAWNFIELCFLTFLSNKSKQLLMPGQISFEYSDIITVPILHYFIWTFWQQTFKSQHLHFYSNRLRWNYHFCCSSFLDEKHLPVMWSRSYFRAEQRRRQPVMFLVYWRLRGVGHVSP